MAMRAEHVIARAEELLEYLGSLDEVKRYYEAREREVHDEVTRTTGAKKESLLEVAKRMLDKGVPIEQITEYTGLSIGEVEKLE